MALSFNPTVSVSFPKTSTLISDPTVVEMISEIGSHEVAILTYAYPDTTTTIPTEGTPVQITYGDLGSVKLNSFYGYVNHHEAKNERTGSVLEIYCLGTSLPLNSPHPQTWTKSTSNKIVEDVAKRQNMRSVQTKSSEVLDSWVQSGETDFKMLERLARRDGMRFWISDSTIYFIDPSTILQGANSRNTVTLNMNHDFRTDTLMSFKPLVGSLVPGNRAVSVNNVYGVDSNGKTIKVSSSQGSSLVQSILSKTIEYSATSPAEAKSIAQKQANNANWSTGIAQIATTSALNIGNVVDLEGSQLYGTYAGNWLITGINDKFVIPRNNQDTSTQRVTHLTVSRNQPNQHVTKGTPGYGKSIPYFSPKLNNKGVWVSQASGTTYVG